MIVIVSVGLMVGKFAAYLITNSVGILTDAMESIVNVVAGFISLYSLHYAAKPKDDSHPFGHGKIELISASAEGVLILGAGSLIIYEGISRFYHPTEVGRLDTGILVVAVAGFINYILGSYSIRMGKKHDSIALVAGGKHLQSDTYSTIGLVIGLILLYITRIAWIDSALALLFGCIIAVTGISILRKTVANLMDQADHAILTQTLTALEEHRQSDWINIHNLKILKYGSYFYIDCDLTLPWYYTVTQGHDAYERLRSTLSKEFSERVQFSIHIDPCQPENCPHCTVTECLHRKAPFISPLKPGLEQLVYSDE